MRCALVAALVAAGALLAGCGSARPFDGRRCTSAESCLQIHPDGIADPESADFHGHLFTDGGDKLGDCTACHGKDLTGGTSGKSCMRCHDDSTSSCTVCHGQPPATGAHQRHVPKYDCTACHVKPTGWTQVGHIFAADGTRLPHAPTTVSFDGTRCSGTYCHGDATPAWNGGAAEATCGSCHRIPPSTHALDRCGDCHGRVANNQKMIIDDALHADGKISLGDDKGTCQSCHPSPGGAHASHTQALHSLRGPLGCTECHLVPSSVTSPGHIDHPTPQVFPAGSGPLAFTGGAVPVWDGMTCSGTYCHGNATPTWVPGNGAASCGACHAIPPSTAAHAGITSLAQCAACHPTTMNASGAIIEGGTHLDGTVDAQ